MELIVELREGATILRLPMSKLDLGTAEEFKSAMAPIIAESRCVALDMSNLQFVDSSGLGALLSVLRDLSGKGGDLKLFGVQRRVRAMFDLVRLTHILSIYDTEEEALTTLKSEG